MTTFDPSIFHWEPGQGPHAAALERMCAAFPRPREPMGEAWFMSEQRETYPELLGDLAALTDTQIVPPLVEIATGASCFGPRDEWTDWYHYLLPRLLQRPPGPYSRSLAELLITGFMAEHPDPVGRGPYPLFRVDALATLGRYVMSPHLWRNGTRFASESGGLSDCDCLLSASLFFRLKYLDAGAVEPWLESVFAIEDRYWMAQILFWLIGAHPILSGAITQPAQFPEGWPFAVSWNWSHALRGNYSGNFDPPVAESPFLLEENRQAALRTIARVDLAKFIEDVQTDPGLQHLATEMDGAAERFAELYASRA
ncbi:hypothetical protein FHS95_001046 [Sphingomonas naasensis]|uniref:Uncharacterized protein n=1 Tax=Sphingomonas naasensis TaxID=1344951 RepID=A0A4S1W9L0_9SPHN|nr:hypothetical protein [Sphingomonas naasensis]NIJ19377.1 hypothetical protein [Sphingomonas naasensis]TGX39123.1 hypothetical protein E5A74_16495 [Sphingomonas naasensis]